jgi:hypothetical protein
LFGGFLNKSQLLGLVRQEKMPLQAEPEKESRWTQSVAVGSKSYIEDVKKRLGFKARARSIDGGKGQYQLKEDVSNFGNTSAVEMEYSAEFEAGLSNTYLWQQTS